MEFNYAKIFKTLAEPNPDSKFVNKASNIATIIQGVLKHADNLKNIYIKGSSDDKKNWFQKNSATRENFIEKSANSFINFENSSAEPKKTDDFISLEEDKDFEGGSIDIKEASLSNIETFTSEVVNKPYEKQEISKEITNWITPKRKNGKALTEFNFTNFKKNINKENSLIEESFENNEEIPIKTFVFEGVNPLNLFAGFSSHQNNSSTYRKTMKTLTLTLTEDERLFNQYLFQDSENLSESGLIELNNEFWNFTKTIHCSEDFAFFLFVNTIKTALAKIFVTGRPDSSFAYGIYSFDCLIPSNYPELPPKLFMNDRNQNIKWSPRISEERQILLKILNTYDCDKFNEKNWNGNNNFFCISEEIRRVFMKDYQNHQNSEDWHFFANLEIKYANIKYSIIEMLKNPLPGYEMLIFLHFQFVHSKISDKIKEWIEEIKISPFKYFQEYKPLNPQIFKILIDESPVKVFEDLLDEFNREMVILNSQPIILNY